VWYPVTKAVGNVHYDKEDCVDELKSDTHRPNSIKSDITKFFQPVSKTSPSPKISHYFSPKPLPSIPPQTPCHRNFDEEVEDLPDEVFDWPEVRMDNTTSPPQTVPQPSQSSPQQSPTQTVPHTPQQDAQQPTTRNSTHYGNKASAPMCKVQLTSKQPLKCKRKLEFEVIGAKKLPS